MPLINKKRFEPNPIPKDLAPDDEVFYYGLTNEIFTSHDEFFDRFLYCNSLIWTCEKTGKSGLTYQEALESEQAFNQRKRGSDGQEPVKKKKKYPYDPKKYSMPVPEGFDPSLLTPTGKIDGRKLKSKKNQQLAEELLLASGYDPTTKPKQSSSSPDTQATKKSKKKKDKEEEAKKKEEDGQKKAQLAAELAKERELEAKRKKEAAALAKQLERQKREEERKKAAAFLQSWEKKCEDLERDDLKRLPQPTPISCDIPERLFGDAVFILESMYNLHELYQLSDIFPEGINYDILEDMLLERHDEGALGTVIQFLLKLIFNTQPTGDGYGLDDDPSVTATTTTENKIDGSNPSNDLKHDGVKPNQVKVEQNGTESSRHDHETNGISGDPGEVDPEAEEHEDEDDEEEMNKEVRMNDLIGSAIKAAQEVRKSLSKPLVEMEIDTSNVTEILRLHLLQSGSFPKGRTIYNGWYSSREDPGLWLCMQEPDLIRKLAEVTIFDLDIEERIKILHTLVYQLFSFIKTRLHIESASDQLTELRKKYRHEAATFGRWDRENCVKRLQDSDLNNPQQPGGENEPMDAEAKAQVLQQNQVDYDDYQRERTIRQEQLNQTLLSIRSNLRSIQAIYGIHPIGRDRAYRRYWLFQSLPGLFVEQDDSYVGRCLPNPTPLESQYKKLFNKDNPLMHPCEADLIRAKACDKDCLNDENETKDATGENGLSSDINNVTDTKQHQTQQNGQGQHPDSDNEPSGISDEMNICTGDESSCAIHGQKRISQPRWWFYHTPQAIDSLVESLNKRGYRESKLQDVIASESSLIKPWISNCPAYKLNGLILEQSGMRRSRRLRTKGGKRRGRNYD